MRMQAEQRPIRFLLIEDDDDHAKLIERAMNENRIANELTRVSDGEQAIAYLRADDPYPDAERPDVILLDLKMPRIDGHQVLQMIKTDPELSPIPVVVMTTSASESDRHRAYAAHANSYLVKPLDFEQFNEMVHQLRMYWAVWNEISA